MLHTPVISDSSRIAVSRKGPPVGCPRCLQVAVSTAQHRTGLVLGSGATVGPVTGLLLATPGLWLRTLTRLSGLNIRCLTLGLMIGLVGRTR